MRRRPAQRAALRQISLKAEAQHQTGVIMALGKPASCSTRGKIIKRSMEKTADIMRDEILKFAAGAAPARAGGQKLSDGNSRGGSRMPRGASIAKYQQLERDGGRRYYNRASASRSRSAAIKSSA